MFLGIDYPAVDVNHGIFLVCFTGSCFLVRDTFPLFASMFCPSVVIVTLFVNLSYLAYY